MRGYKDRVITKDGAEELTPRERQVLSQVAKEKTSKEIASFFGISRGAVETHMGHIRQKLHAENRKEAVRIARDLAWI